MELELEEHRLGLAQPALPTAKLGQPKQRLRRQSRRMPREKTVRGLQLCLGAPPVAAPGQHSGVVGATDPEEGVHLVALAEVAHALAPLAGAIPVADPLAGVDQVAERQTDRFPVAGLAGEGGGRRLVEP
jgi:hypothetical protein